MPRSLLAHNSICAYLQVMSLVACHSTLPLNPFDPSNIWTMTEKRATRSQNYKQFQLHQQKKLCFPCDVLPPSKFDFSFADPAFGNIYELLEVTHLYLCATPSPVSSSLLHILQQLAAHTTSTVAKSAVQTIKLSMIEQIPLTLQSSECTFSTIPDSFTDSTFCFADPRDYFFSS